MNLELTYLQIIQIETLIGKEIEFYEEWLKTNNLVDGEPYLNLRIKELNDLLDKFKKTYDF
jgi:hypothetical protein